MRVMVIVALALAVWTLRSAEGRAIATYQTEAGCMSVARYLGPEWYCTTLPEEEIRPLLDLLERERGRR